MAIPIRCSINATTVALAVAGVLWGGGSALGAGALVVNCSDDRSGEAIKFSFEGEGSGTLTVVAPFGTAALPATLSAPSSTKIDDQTVSMQGLRAGGPATLRMPDQAALEECIVKRRIAGEPADKDFDSLSAMACEPELKVMDAPIAVDVDVAISLMDGEMMTLVMTRTYPNTSTVTGDRLQLVRNAFLGPFHCAVAK